MTKDPAFLFYSSDFLTGTILMTNEQVGIYVKLLCIQHQHGGLIDKQSFESMVSGNDIIKSKFICCDGGYYNQRLMKEMEKRKHKSENLSLNAIKSWENRSKRKANAYADVKQMQSRCNAIADDLHMPIDNSIVCNTTHTPESSNQVIKDTVYKKFVPPTLEEVTLYAKSRGNHVDSTTFFDFFNASGWVDSKGKPVLNWKQKYITWESRSESKIKQQNDKKEREKWAA